MLPHGHSKADARHLHLHRAAFEKLASHPELVTAAVERIDEWLTNDPEHPARSWLEEWREMLATWPLERVAERVLDEPGGQVLRQTSPLVSVLTPRERWAALDEVNRRLATREADAPATK